MTEEGKIKSVENCRITVKLSFCDCDMDYLKAILFFTTAEGN